MLWHAVNLVAFLSGFLFIIGDDLLKVKRGQLTFDAEGDDKKGSRYFSRVPHVPTSSSGITLGRGYDLKHKSQKKVFKDLESIGISKCTAAKFSKGVGIKGNEAKNYLKKNGITEFLITHEQQKKLFDITYKEEAAEAKRIATKSDVEEAYGKTDWDKLNDAIRDVVVDLKYRGDYTPKTRKKIQAAIASNDLKRFTKLMSDRDYWLKQIGVPKDRFERRKAALEFENC